MKKFQFRLQKVLELREKLEQQQKNKLAKAAAEYQEILLKQETTQNIVDSSRQQLYNSSDHLSMSIDALRNLDLQQKQANQFIRSMNPELQKKKQIMEQEKQKYLKTLQDKKAIELLKEKELKIHKKLVEKSEISNIDEISKYFTHPHHNKEY